MLHWLTGVLIAAAAMPGAGTNRGEVLVFGGTGRLGAPIARLLAADGYAVTVFARPTSDRARLAGLDIAFVTGDLLDGPSVAAALRDLSFDYVVDASARGASSQPFYAAAMRNILAAIADAGVRQFILHGSVGAGDNLRLFPDAGFERMQSLMAEKGEAEQLLRDSGIDYTIIRNGIVRVDGTPATGTAALSEDQTRLSTVTRLDLAALTLQCVGNRTCVGKTYHAVDD